MSDTYDFFVEAFWKRWTLSLVTVPAEPDNAYRENLEEELDDWMLEHGSPEALRYLAIDFVEHADWYVARPELAPWLARTARRNAKELE